MPTANETLLERSISHQLFLQRHSQGEVKKILKLLAKIESNILSRLARTDLTSLSRERQQLLLASIRKIILNGYKPLSSTIRREAHKLAKYEVAFQASMITSIIPVSVDFVVPTSNQIVASISNAPYIGKPMREWLNGMGKATASRVKDVLRTGFAEGQTNGQIMETLRGTKEAGYSDGVLGMSRRSAEMVVRTTMNSTANVARNEVYKENADLVKGVQWVSTLDNRTSLICASRDGLVFLPDKGPRPPAHPNCRSTTVPVLKSWKEAAAAYGLKKEPEGTRASMTGTKGWLDGQVPESITYGEWLKKQPRGIQEDVLGIDKAKLFRDGDLTIDRFVDRKGNALTLDELRIKEPEAWRAAGFGVKMPNYASALLKHSKKLHREAVGLKKQRDEAIDELGLGEFWGKKFVIPSRSSLVGRQAQLATKIDDLNIAMWKKAAARNPDALVRTLSGEWVNEWQHDLDIRTGQRILVPFDWDTPSSLKSKLKEADQHLLNLIHPDIRPRVLGVRVEAEDSRAHYNSSTETVHIASNAQMRTVLHEAVHALEFNHPDILKKTTTFLMKRAGHEIKNVIATPSGALSLGDKDDHKVGLTEYNGELGYSDKWVERGGDQYTGRDYSVVTGGGVFTLATEILTTGVERLTKDPLDFAERDPEHFNFIMGIFRNVR